jgi:carboxymethylenebutenolidase
MSGVARDYNRRPVDVLSEILDASTPSGPMAILHKRPQPEGDWPRVVMFHDGPGIRNATHVFATKLAAEGYAVAVPDLYHRHGRMIGFEPHEREADPALVEYLWELLASLTDDDIQADLDVTLATLAVESSEQLGVIGFCVGARAVFRSMMRLPATFAAGAMWHPSFLADDEPDSPHRSASALARPLFIGIGGADVMQPIEAHQRFLEAVEPLPHVEVEVFPGADHAFTWPEWPNYDENAASGCFRKTLSLFTACLAPAGGR